MTPGETPKVTLCVIPGVKIVPPPELDELDSLDMAGMAKLIFRPCAARVQLCMYMSMCVRMVHVSMCMVQLGKPSKQYNLSFAFTFERVSHENERDE